MVLISKENILLKKKPRMQMESFLEEINIFSTKN